MKSGLTGRMAVASGLLAVIVGGAFAVVLLTGRDLRGTTDLRRQTSESLVAADTLERHVVDLETGLRGFVITRDESFLEPSNAARAALPNSARALERLSADEPVQLARVRRIVRAMNAYLTQFALPLVDAVRRNDPSVRSVERNVTAKQRVDALRAGLNSFREAERARLSERDADVDQAASRATVAAGVGVAGSVLLILLFAGYLTRVIVQPLRRGARMADRLAGGDLTARMRETDIAEIGALERSFNSMAGSLEKSQDELASLAAEQAALRRVATIVAGGAEPTEVFAVTAAEVGGLLGSNATAICRFEPDAKATVLALETDTDLGVSVGARITLEGESAMAAVFRTGRAARQDSFERTSGPVADIARKGRMGSSVGAPIAVEGHLWGVVVVSSSGRSLPPDTEQRLGDFCELVATTIANAESRAALALVSDQQAALRRVATLVAEAPPPAKLFEAVADELGRLLGADYSGMIRYEDDSSVSTVAAWAAVGEHPPVPDRWKMEPGDPASMIAETCQPARVEDWTAVPGPIATVIREQLEVSSSVGCPIVVEGRLWGAIAVHSKRRAPLPPDTEARTAQFAALVATAIANTEARAEVERLADEQAALRRVATLVAREAPQVEVFTSIAEEVRRLFGDSLIYMFRYEDGGDVVAVASAGDAADVLPVGSRHELGGMNAATRVFNTGRPVRIDDYTTATGPIAGVVSTANTRGVVGTPLVIDGRLWGVMVVGTTGEESLPPETELRLGQFTELMATTIANTESHARADRLAEEQAALRRVATLVAKESPPAEVFAKVAEELSTVLGNADSSLFRHEGDGIASAVALWGTHLAAGVRVGTRIPVDGDGLIASVLREGRPWRIGDYSAVPGVNAERGRELGVRSAVGCPIVVGERIWGAMAVVRYEDEAFPPDTEMRIEQFADLVATAVANAEARAEVERLADEQAGLRRVATLVAEGAAPTAVFDAVAGEVEALLDADQVALNRFEPGAEIVVLAHRGLDVAQTPVGSRLSHKGESVTATVHSTGRPARKEHQDGTSGALAELARETGLRVTVGAPITVDGRLWGIINASWKGEEPPPADAEDRLAHFAELLDTAIANADSRDQLMASRARLLSASDEARRRVVRDLHDGAQQRLVLTIMALGQAQRSLREDDGRADALIGDALGHAEEGHAELRELARGMLPSVLSHGGLRAGVDAFVARLDLPVSVDVPAERFPPEAEASAYFIVAEALTNAVKHAHAKHAEVRVSAGDELLRLEVRDDGVGGADPDGHGLVGLGDRATALGGRLTVESPAGGGTVVAAAIPLTG